MEKDFRKTLKRHESIATIALQQSIISTSVKLLNKWQYMAFGFFQYKNLKGHSRQSYFLVADLRMQGVFKIVNVDSFKFIKG